MATLLTKAQDLIVISVCVVQQKCYLMSPGFFQMGHALYNDRPQDLGVAFLEIDMLDDNFFKNHKKVSGKFDLVHSANVIHLFDETQQETFIRALAFLVKPGGMIWGRQVGLEDMNDDNEKAGNRFRRPEGKGMRFSIPQFRRLWLRATGWDADTVEYKAELVPYEELREKRADKRWVLQWSVRAPMILLDNQTAVSNGSRVSDEH